MLEYFTEAIPVLASETLKLLVPRIAHIIPGSTTPDRWPCMVVLVSAIVSLTMKNLSLEALLADKQSTIELLQAQLRSESQQSSGYHESAKEHATMGINNVLSWFSKLMAFIAESDFSCGTEVEGELITPEAARLMNHSVDKPYFVILQNAVFGGLNVPYLWLLLTQATASKSYNAMRHLPATWSVWRIVDTDLPLITCHTALLTGCYRGVVRHAIHFTATYHSFPTSQQATYVLVPEPGDHSTPPKSSETVKQIPEKGISAWSNFQTTDKQRQVKEGLEAERQNAARAAEEARTGISHEPQQPLFNVTWKQVKLGENNERRLMAVHKDAAGPNKPASGEASPKSAAAIPKPKADASRTPTAGNGSISGEAASGRGASGGFPSRNAPQSSSIPRPRSTNSAVGANSIAPRAHATRPSAPKALRTPVNRVCKDWRNGHCSYGKECRYLHALPPCYDFQSPRGCNRGDKCAFSHVVS